MKHIMILILIAFAAGCSSSKNTGGWNLGTQGGSGNSYRVPLVPSRCSVTTAVGTFSVQGPVCFIANNNAGQGSISGSGIPTSPKSTGQGVLIGVASNPVPANAAFSLVFVAGDGNATVVEFTGGGTIANGTMTGTGSCSSSTPLCQGMSGTFTGTAQ
jgi:hypothetical protein